MRAPPLEPSVELPMGPRNAVLGGGDACGPHWGLPWSSTWGHETCEGCAEMGVKPHANFATEAFGGAPDGATTRVRDVPTLGLEPHANFAT